MESIAIDRRIRLNHSYGFRAGIEINGEIYFSARNCKNALYKSDMKNGRTEFLGAFAVKSEHDFCCRIREDLWFFPMDHTRSQIDIYHMDSGKFDTIDIPFPDTDLCETYGAKFISIVENGANKYIIPGTYDYIICVNRNGKIDDYLKIPVQYLAGGVHRFSDALLYKSQIFFCPYDSDCFLRLDLDHGKFYGLKWNYEKKAFGWICEYQERLYVIPSKEYVNVVSINDDFSGVLETDICLNVPDEKYKAAGYMDGRIWLFPHNTNIVSIISLEEQKAEYAEIFTESQYRNDKLGYCSSVKSADGLYFSNYGYGTPVAKVCRTGDILFLSITENSRDELEYLYEMMKQKACAEEKSSIGAKIYREICD